MAETKIKVVLTERTASALITLVGQLTPDDLDRVCVGHEHRREIDRFFRNMRGRLQWPRDEYGRPR